MAFSTNQKIAIAVGVTAAVVLVGSTVFAKPVSAKSKETAAPPPRPPGLNFSTRNLDALNAIVAAIVADPKAGSAGVSVLADQLDYFGLFAQGLRLREKVTPSLRMMLTSISSGSMSLRMAMAKK